MAQYQLAVKERDTKGKEAAKKMRQSMDIPGIFYGAKSEPIMVTFIDGELRKILKSAASKNIILNLQIQSAKGTDSKLVILKELQSDPLKERYIHADFCEISLDKELILNIPVILINTPAGVALGGVLQHVRRELTIKCLPDKVIEKIEIDVSGLGVGDSLHIRDVAFPEGITSTQEGHLTVAVVNAPAAAEKAAPGEEGEEAKAEEPEKK
ncbi:MAG: 50S ribosomal protein L25 [Desulfatiglans sp.]|jgi:large subunit ribosomal protein L25|nr:50S ribosomal protein L25 [Desulfatiglans sp.]